MNLSLFKQAAFDSVHSPYGTFKWHTWSDELRNCFIDVTQNPIFKNLTPSLIYFTRFNQYNYTYQINGEIIEKLDPEKRLDPFITLLNEFDPGEDLWFFTDLIDGEIDAKVLHVFFSIFRSRISVYRKMRWLHYMPP